MSRCWYSGRRKTIVAAMMPIAVRLVPGLLRARGVAAGLKELTEALALGAVPGRRERGRWLLSEADLDAAERYFRERAARGAWKGGAAALARAGRIGPAGPREAEWHRHGRQAKVGTSFRHGAANEPQ